MVVTRIAPSPSGRLHAGNAVNFLLTDWVARAEPGSRVHLRIDDMNLPDVAERFVEDIFWAVDWLGIAVTDGPDDAADFRARHSQYGRREEYRAALRPLIETGAAYPCRCSRTMLAARPPGAADPCRRGGVALLPGESALRFRLPADAPADVAAELGDFVVWRRDDLPAYHLVSVLEDDRAGVDTVVRGADLRASSGAQVLLARALGISSFPAARFVHHELLFDGHGRKMSKRDDADALHALAAEPGGRERLVAEAARVAAAAGITPAP